ncbi:MAG TPA: hypothetical protein VF590_00805 [Isosphaeraceae bacterium]|jgi:hypothetical protein
MTQTKWYRGVALLGAVAATVVALGADAPPQTIDAGGLTFQAPGSWKSSRPSSFMRRAQLAVPPAQGAGESAELVVFAFPGGAGTVQQNVARWQQQFEDPSGKPPRITSEARRGKNVDVTVVECAGRYVAAVQPGSPERLDKPDYRMLAAIVQTPEVAYFLKMVGPDATVKAAKPAFDDLCKSITVPRR